MSRIDDIISDQAYILDCLMTLRDIFASGDCNECSAKHCEYAPKPGQMVRYNCPFFKRNEEGIR